MKENILQQIIYLGKPAALKLQQEITQFYRKNTTEFINALESNNLAKAREINNIGMDWSQPQHWTKIAKIWRGEASPEIIKFIWTLTPDELYIKQGHLVGHDEKYKTMLDKKEVFREFLKANLNDLFNNYTHLPINNYLASWILTNQKDELQTNPKYLKSLCLCISKTNIAQNIEFIEEVVKSYPKQLFLFLNSASNTEDFNVMLKSKVFMQAINQKNEDIELGKQESMLQAVTKGNLEQIVFYHDLGVEFPSSKAPYSSLFSKADKAQAMEYVIHNMPDISIGSSVVLKTVLHYNKVDLVSQILDRYPRDAQDTLEAIIDKRAASASVEAVKSSMLKMKLDEALSPKPTSALVKI